MPLQFSSPAALWALAALALPLALHLWRPPPRTVRLGSLHFLTNAPRPLRNLRWRELFLLYTRLGLLALLALLIAGPRWLKMPTAGPRRWALLDPAAAPAGTSLERWRAARAASYEFHRLTPGLPVIGSDATPPNAEPDAPAPDVWSLLREADAGLPAGSELAVFSPGRVAGLRGARPALGHCRVEWVQTPDAVGNAPRAWIESAEASTDTLGKGRFVFGRSDAGETVFQSGTLDVSAARTLPAAFRGGELLPLEIAPADAGHGFSARLRDRDGTAAPGSWTVARPAAGTLHALILHDPTRAEDARYLEAAVRAAGQFDGNSVNAETHSTAPLLGNVPSVDWLFWLSARPVPESVASRAVHLLSDAPDGETETTLGWIVAPPGTAGADALADGVRLWKTSTPNKERAGTVYWSDGRGNPLLTDTLTGNCEHWHFSGRFHPDWNDLPRTAALASWMRGLLFPAGDTPPFAFDPINDRRLADPAQCSPGYLPTAAAGVSAAAPNAVDLHWPIWIIAAMLFMAERALSHHRVGVRLIPATAAPTERELAAAES